MAKKVSKKSASKKSASKKTTTKSAEKRTLKVGAIRAKASSASTPQPAAGSQRFSIVGLGASAGGLESLEDFFRHMPAESGIAFVVVMHQAAKHVSLLPELLDKCTNMDVAAIHDRMTVEQNHVYIVPPGKHVDLLDGIMYLSNLPEKHVAPLPIDCFFRSLAEERRELAIAIVLSGTGTDGTVGLSAIKGESGMVMVQSVESAKFSGMPQHAIDTGLADYVVAPFEMPEKLIAYAAGPFLKSPKLAGTHESPIQLALPEILIKLRRRCGHDFSGYKTSTICRRIERRLNVHQIEEPKQYLHFLEEHQPEADALFRDLLIGVTSFFRDEWAFDALSKIALIPRLREKSNDSQFRVWVPGCSTGEEAYSIAIMLRECMDQLKIHLNVQIFATDLDEHAIEAARLGLFPSGIGADVSAQRVAQFFTKEDVGYRIRNELRDWLIFAPQNVIHDPPFTKLDLISCRNLLIYMQPELQRKLLSLFHYSLYTGGNLFLGTSETIGEFDDLFQTVDAKAKVFRRNDSIQSSHRQIQFPVVDVSTVDKAVRSEVAREQLGTGIREAITTMLANELAPPTIIVTESGEILHVHGRTGMFLELAPGGPPKSIVSMAREGLQLELTSALRKAARQEATVVHQNVPVSTNGHSVLINLVVKRISQPLSIRGLLRVSFVLIGEVMSPPEPQTEETEPKSRKRLTSREKELERELQSTRETLQHTIEEVDASNEEMKSTNEELQSTNEELQSTNEELETSKEELQSLNEELQTVNAEFQEKIRELSTTNDDMNNLLDSTDIATIFLDNTLHIKRFTDQAKRIISVIPTDVGRSLRDLTSHLLRDELVHDGVEVLKTLIPKEQEVRTKDGRVLLMRIMPYRTAENRIDGLVLTFVDINTLRQVEEAHGLNEALIDASPVLMSYIDANQRFVFTNSVCERMTGKTREQLKGQLLRDVIGEKAYRIAQPRFEAAMRGEPQQFENQVRRDDGSAFEVRMQFVPRRDEQKQVIGVFATVTDIEVQRQAESQQALFEAIVETLREPMLVLDGSLRVRTANRAFYDTFRMTPQQTEQQVVFELGDKQWDIPALRAMLEGRLATEPTVDHLEVALDVPGLGPRRMLLNVRRISTSPGQPSLILLAIEDLNG